MSPLTLVITSISSCLSNFLKIAERKEHSAERYESIFFALRLALCAMRVITLPSPQFSLALPFPLWAIPP
jgi:hypothetical protein